MNIDKKPEKLLAILVNFADLVLIVIVNLVILAIIFIHTSTLYIIPFRDMNIGIYPPKKIIELLYSFWSFEGFGSVSSIPLSYLYMFILESLLPASKAFVVYTMTPYIIISLVSYYSLRLIGLRDKVTIVLLSFLYTYNWFTLYLYGSVLVLYTYAGGLLFLASLYKILYENVNAKWKLRIIELTLAFILAMFSWNLPGLILILYIVIPAIIAGFSYYKLSYLKKLKEVFKSLVGSIMLASSMLAPFIFSKIIGVISYGVKGYAIATGYVSPLKNWVALLEPRYFSLYIGNIMKILSLFVSPTLNNLIYIITMIIIIIIVSLALISKDKNLKVKSFLIANILYIAILYILISQIINRNPIVNTIYNTASVIVILRTVTNYMVIMAPSLFIVYTLSINKLKMKHVKYVILCLIVLSAALSNNYLLVKIPNLSKLKTVTIGELKYKVITVNHSLIKLFKQINSERHWRYRVLWLPVYRGERSLFLSTTEDLPISKSPNKKIAKCYNMLLRALLSKYKENNGISKLLLKLFGIKYIVLLKMIDSNGEPKIEYQGYSPVAVEGNYKIIENLLKRKQYLKEIKNCSDYILYEYKYNATLFNLVKAYSVQRLKNKTNYTSTPGNASILKIYINNRQYRSIKLPISLLKVYNDTYLARLDPGRSLVFRFHGYLRSILCKAKGNVLNLAVIYYRINTMYENIINVCNAFRVLIRTDGRILVQYDTTEGIVNQFSKSRLLPGQVYYVTIALGQKQAILAIDGIIDSIMKLNGNIMAKNDIITVGSSSVYKFHGYIGNISLVINATNYRKYFEKFIYNIERTYIGSINVNSISAKCTSPSHCIVFLSNNIIKRCITDNYKIFVSLKLNNYWSASSGSTQLSIVRFKGFSAVSLNNISNNSVINLHIKKVFNIAKDLSFIISIIGFSCFIYLLFSYMKTKRICGER